MFFHCFYLNCVVFIGLLEIMLMNIEGPDAIHSGGGHAGTKARPDIAGYRIEHIFGYLWMVFKLLQ